LAAFINKMNKKAQKQNRQIINFLVIFCFAFILVFSLNHTLF